jgi:hypothetical protein
MQASACRHRTKSGPMGLLPRRARPVIEADELQGAPDFIEFPIFRRPRRGDGASCTCACVHASVDARSNATASRNRSYAISSRSRHNRRFRLRPNLVILAHPKVEARLCDPVLRAVLNVADVTKYIAGGIRLELFPPLLSYTISVLRATRAEVLARAGQ